MTRTPHSVAAYFFFCAVVTLSAGADDHAPYYVISNAEYNAITENNGQFTLPKNTTFCGVGHRCCGLDCSGHGEDTHVLDASTSECCRRFPFTVVGAGIARGPSFLDDPLNADRGYVEYEVLRRTNIVVRKAILHGHVNDHELLGKHNPRPHADVSPDVQLFRPSGLRCVKEFCSPLPCTFLDMNYAGHPLLDAKSETYIISASDSLNTNVSMYYDGINMQHITTYGEDLPNAKEKVTFVDGQTTCNPLFGYGYADGQKHAPLNGAIPAYISHFPTAKKAEVHWIEAKRSGTVLPIRKAIPTVPDHYFVDGAIGRLHDGPMVRTGLPCRSRKMPPYLLPYICQGTVLNPKGCVGSPKGRSYGQKTMSEAAHSMLDVMLANGMWIGQKDGQNIAVSWVDRDDDKRDMLRDPRTLSDVMAGKISDSAHTLNHEAVHALLFKNPVFSTKQPAVLGFLNHKNAYIGDGFSDTCTGFLEGQECKITNLVYPYNFFSLQNKPGTATLSKEIVYSNRWRDAIYTAGFTVWPPESSLRINQYKNGFDDNLKGPGQLMNMTNCNWANPFENVNASNRNSWPPYYKNQESIDGNVKPHLLPCTVLGYNYQHLLVKMFSLSAMISISGDNKASYYHPFFVKEEGRTRCVLYDDDAGLTDEGTPFEPTRYKGYCSCTGYALSVVALIASINHGDCGPTCKDICKSDSTDITKCEITSEWQTHACDKYKPSDVATSVKQRNRANCKRDATKCYKDAVDGNTGMITDSGMIADDMCDLNVCDIGPIGNDNQVSSFKYRCIDPTSHLTQTRHDRTIIGSPPNDPENDLAYVSAWYRSDIALSSINREERVNSGSIMREQNDVSWENAFDTTDKKTHGNLPFFITSAQDRYINSILITQDIAKGLRYTSAIGMALPKGESPLQIDYSKSVRGHSIGITWLDSPRNAAYEGTDNDLSHACTCDHQPLVYECNLDVFKTNIRYLITGEDSSVHPLVKTLYKAGTLLESKCGYSFADSRHGPVIGTYIPSTFMNVTITERDIFPLPKEYSTIPKERYESAKKKIESLMLGSHVPTATTAERYLRYDPETPNNDADVEVHKTVFRRSCMRYPYGRIHRNQLTPTLKDALYLDGVTNEGYIDDERSLRGYCELTNAHGDESNDQFFYCHNNQQSAEARRDFCLGESTRLLAQNVMYSLSIGYMDEDTSCHDRLKICLVAPGALEHNQLSTYLSPAPGRRSRNNYVILALPGLTNTFLLRFRMAHMRLPTIPRPKSPYMMPRSSNPKDFTTMFDVSSEETKQVIRSTFGYEPEHTEKMLLLASDLTQYIDHACKLHCSQHDAIVEINKVVTNFVNHLFNKSLMERSGPCTGGWYIPDDASDGLSTKLCVKDPREVLLPYEDVAIPVLYNNITLKSAYSPNEDHSLHAARPVHFKGFAPTAGTCERFLVYASSVTLDIVVNQKGCERFATDGSFLITPVKLLGTVVADTTILLTLTTIPSDHVAVAILGGDREANNARVPAVMRVRNLHIAVAVDSVTAQVNATAMFDAAMARVAYDNDGADGSFAERDAVRFVCASFQAIEEAERSVLAAIGIPEGGDGVATAGCSLLLQGESRNELLLEQVGGKSTFRMTEDAFADPAAMPCVEQDPGDDNDALRETCTYVNVTRYTQIFGAGFERMEFQRPKHHENGLIALCAVLGLVLSGLVAMNVAMAFSTDVNQTAHAIGLVDMPLTADMIKQHVLDQEADGEDVQYTVDINGNVIWGLLPKQFDDGDSLQDAAEERLVRVPVDELYSAIVNESAGGVHAHAWLAEVPAELKTFVLLVHTDDASQKKTQ